MNLSLSEYKNLRIKEINYFLNGINLSSTIKKDERLLEKISPDCDEFFNSSEFHRKETEVFLRKISEIYTELVHTNIVFANNYEEVDRAVSNFVSNVMRELDTYKAQVILSEFGGQRKVFTPGGISVTLNAKENNLINTGLNFIAIQIGDKLYKFPKNGKEAEKDDVVLNKLNIMMTYVYVLICMIKDKKERQEYFVDYVRERFSPADPRYAEALKFQNIFLNEKNYSDFLTKFDNGLLEVKNLVYSDSKPKSKR